VPFEPVSGPVEQLDAVAADLVGTTVDPRTDTGGQSAKTPERTLGALGQATAPVPQVASHKAAMTEPTSLAMAKTSSIAVIGVYIT
jgi:hypothetical protein